MLFKFADQWQLPAGHMAAKKAAARLEAPSRQNRIPISRHWRPLIQFRNASNFSGCSKT
jgi:hypothetical protein